MVEHPQKKVQKINFQNLFRVFRWRIVKHWIFTTFKTLIWYILLSILVSLVREGSKTNNFAKLLPNQLRKILGENASWERKEFIIFGLILVILYAFVYYFDVLGEEELQIRGGHYVKNCLLDKFRRLPLEERQTYQNEINTLIGVESATIGWYWNHLYNHIFHSALFILLIVWGDWDDIAKMDGKAVLFSFTWLLIVNLISFLFLRIILRNEKKYKEELSKENALINKESNKSILIDSMGLSSEYEQKQKFKTKNNQNLLLFFARAKTLNKTIPERLIEIYPFLLLVLTGDFVGKSLFAFWEIFDNLKEIFQCLWDYGDYKSSLIRINKFLKLPEKDDNLSKIQLKDTIKKISFQEIYFKYSTSQEWILEGYTNNFEKKEINKLLGENGTGKSTIIYLLLGMLKPQKGQIIIHCKDGKSYNLNEEINLKYWRENNIAYCSHDNLIEEGSTGQKQAANIGNILGAKKEAKVVIFDEATNALDKEKQEEVEKKLKKMLEDDKIIVYTKH